MPSSHKTIKHHRHIKYKNKEIALKLHTPSLSQRPKTSRNINTQTSLLSTIPPSFYKSSYNSHNSNNIKTISSTTTTSVHPCPNISNITLRQHILTKSTLSYDTNNINNDRSHSISSQCKVNNVTMEFQPEPIDPIYLLYYPNQDRTIRSVNNNNINNSNSCNSRSRNKIKLNSNNNNIKQCQTFNNTVNTHTHGLANTKHLLNLTTNKLLFANIATSKKYFLLSQLQCDNNSNSNSNANEPVKYINELKRKYGIKKSSIIDRYIFKIVNPEGIIEDFITEDESKPSDKYKRLRNQISKGRNKVYRIIQDIKRKQMITDTAFKIPLRRGKIQLPTAPDDYYLNSN